MSLHFAMLYFLSHFTNTRKAYTKLSVYIVCVSICACTNPATPAEDVSTTQHSASNKRHATNILQQKEHNKREHGAAKSEKREQHAEEQTLTRLRIISLSPASTDFLMELELSASIVGKTRFCDASLQARELGTGFRPQLETLAEMKPTHIFTQSAGDAARMRNAFTGHPELQIALMKYDTLEDNIRSLQRISNLTRASKKKVKAIAQALEKKYRSLIHRLKTQQLALNKGHLKTLAIAGTDPLIVAGRSTYINEIVELLGGTLVSPESQLAWPPASKEWLMQQEPDIVFYLGKDFALPEALTSGFKTNTTFFHNRFAQPGPELFKDIAELSHALGR